MRKVDPPSQPERPLQRQAPPEASGRSLAPARGPGSIAVVRRRLGNAGLARALRALYDPGEREADDVSERVMQTAQPQASGPVSAPDRSIAFDRTPGREEAPPVVESVLRSSGQPLDPPARASMESRFGHDFSQIRIHTDSQADRSARAVAAQAYTAGSHLVFAENRYAPSTGAGARLLAHELAHAVQQRRGAGPAAVVQRQPTTLAGYPEAERRAVRQSTIPATMLDAAFLLTVFGTAAQNGGATTSYTFGGTTVFDTGIPTALQRGLGSTGAYLADQTNVLPLGSTVTVVLDLTPFPPGTSASFRFTHLNHTERGTAMVVLLVENVGPAPAAVAAVTVPTGTFTIRGQSFTAGSGWNAQQWGRLQAVLARLPDAVLTEAAGTTFALRGQGTADEAGHYDATTDTIEMHQNAFPVSATTFGGADSGQRNITHEVGHLLDLRRLERAWRTFNAGGQTAAGRRTFLGERSLSGTRYTQAASGDFEQVDARTTATGNDFRVAATRDGVRPGRAATDPLTGGPTSYSNTDWQELFAESFSLYVNDPRLFEIIRPNLFRYFSTRFPLPAAPAATPATGQTGQTGGGPAARP